MKELKVKISEKAYEALEEYAKSKGLDIELALESILMDIREGVLTEKYLLLVRKLDEVLRSHPSSVGSMYLEAYVNELRKVKEEIKSRGIYIVSDLEEVTISNRTLVKCKDLVIKDCKRVTFKEDVDERLFEERVLKIVNVEEIVAPERLRARIESKIG